MKLDHRRQEIVDIMIEHGSVSLDWLADRFGVSRMTVHRDLDMLQEAGLLRKIRGGATVEASSQFESNFGYRARQATYEKARIAERALNLIEPGQSVILDDSSTVGSIIGRLGERRPLTVITNNLEAITRLPDMAGISLVAIGGRYSDKFRGFFGLLADESLSGLQADTALVSTSAIVGSAAYHQDQEVVQTKRRMIAAASRRYLLVDHAKFGRTALHFLCRLGEFDGVVTGAMPRELAAELAEAGVEVILAEEDTAA